MLANIAAWILDNIPLPGWVQPYIFGIIIGRWPHKVKEEVHMTEETNFNNLITPNSFAVVNTDEFSEQGVNEGDVVFVAAAKALPVDEDDPYLQRVYVFINLTIDYSVDSEHLYLMDPRQLETLNEETSKIYNNQLEIDFNQKLEESV